MIPLFSSGSTIHHGQFLLLLLESTKLSIHHEDPDFIQDATPFTRGTWDYDSNPHLVLCIVREQNEEVQGHLSTYYAI